MATTLPMANLSRETLRSRLRCYYTLTKPEVNLLILMTTSTGYYLAAPGPARILGLLNTLIGTLLVASGTATLNQWMERAWDAQMRRTASRPLPSGRLTSLEALIFGILLSIAGGLYLLLAVNGLSAVLAVLTLLSSARASPGPGGPTTTCSGTRPSAIRRCWPPLNLDWPP